MIMRHTCTSAAKLHLDFVKEAGLSYCALPVNYLLQCSNNASHRTPTPIPRRSRHCSLKSTTRQIGFADAFKASKALYIQSKRLIQYYGQCR